MDAGFQQYCIWTKLASPPFTNRTVLLSTNGYDILSIPKQDRKVEINNDNIYQYCFSNSEWHEITIKHENDQIVQSLRGATIDKENQLVYAYNASKKLMEIDLNNKTTETITKIPIASPQSIFYTNNTVHLFSQNKYRILDQESKEFVIVSAHTARRISGSVVCINARSSVICTIQDGVISGNPLFIAEFSLTDYKWTKLTETSLGNSAMVSTKNDQYVIFLGGYQHRTFSDSILIYDVNRNVFKKSTVNCPCKSWFTAVLTRNDNKDELLTVGYINQCYKLFSFSDIQPVPCHLLQFIANYVCNEKINIISLWGNFKGSHWMINVDEILQSTNELND